MIGLTHVNIQYYPMFRITTMTETAITFEQLQHSLDSASINISAAESQGVLCGLLCCGHGDTKKLWLSELMPDGTDANNLLLTECHQLLQQLYQETHHSFEDPGMGLSLLLPDEETPIGQRAEQLIDWCQGYLYGLGIGKAPIEELSEEAREGIGDITEITKLDIEELATTEQDEIDLTEVTEFVWVVTMLVKEELNSLSNAVGKEP